MKRFGLALILVLLACAPKADRAALRRQPLSPAPASGWARLPLDREAQRAFPQLWLGDASGQPVPFLVERDGLWEPRELEPAHLALGRNPKGEPTADFSLKLPDGWQDREREHLRLQLDLEGQAPWVARVEVERSAEGRAPVSLEAPVAEHLYDLGGAERRSEIRVPWDLPRMRLTLKATQGVAPRIRGLRILAATEPSARAEDEAVSPRWERKGELIRLSLEGPERIVGAELKLRPPLAPIRPAFSLPARDGAPGRPLASVSMLWNLPALDSRAERVALDPVLSDALELRLPSGADLESIRLLVRREVLIFPAEAGRAYFLHQGGQLRQAPGQLGALPASSRGLYQQAPLRLGPAEADPQGISLEAEPGEGLRRYLPWVTGLLVLGLGLVALRMLRGERG